MSSKSDRGMALTQAPHISGNTAECMNNCTDALQAAEWCANECTGSEEMERCAKLCRDVAEITAVNIRFMARDSENKDHIHEACAEICEKCAEECEKHDAEHCEVAAEKFRDCAESCREMAG